MKTVFILIGAKGSGKSYLGKLIEKRLGIKFLLVEKVFLKIQNSRDVLNKSFLQEGYAAVEQKIDEYLKKNDRIIIESTGAFDFFKDFLKRLQSKYNVKLIFLNAPLELCLKRIKNKKDSDHIKMSDKLIKKVYEITNSLKYDYILKIDSSKQNNTELINSFKKII